MYNVVYPPGGGTHITQFTIDALSDLSRSAIRDMVNRTQHRSNGVRLVLGDMSGMAWGRHMTTDRTYMTPPSSQLRNTERWLCWRTSSPAIRAYSVTNRAPIMYSFELPGICRLVNDVRTSRNQDLGITSILLVNEAVAGSIINLPEWIWNTNTPAVVPATEVVPAEHSAFAETVNQILRSYVYAGALSQADITVLEYLLHSAAPSVANKKELLLKEIEPVLVKLFGKDLGKKLLGSI